MATEYHHGVKVITSTDGVRPIRTVSTAIVGVVGTAPDADSDVFPMDTPVLVASREKAAKLDTADSGSGTLPRALQGIYDQALCSVVVVRVSEGTSESETTTNIIGEVDSTTGKHKGLEALRVAESQLGVKPRILGTPGHASQEVTSALTPIAADLRAFAYAGAVGATESEVITYRENFGDRRLMLIWPDFMGWDSATDSTSELSAVARALGTRARIDQETGWHKTISNVAVEGVTGISADVSFDLQNPNTVANRLNDEDITTLVRRNGFRFWGSRTCADDPLYAFESAVRTDDILADTIAEAHAWAIDLPMSKQLIRDIVEGTNAKFRQLALRGYIVDAQAWVDPEKNTESELSAGKLAIDYDFTPVPPLEQLGFYQTITSRYLSQLVPA
ncbi:phage tail sheath protein [Halorhodospira neutriphila]|uniref:Phage tail protein n=1 Tax=Halorhodospira neutriphila TaxID=168379 RepID=A0ABS1E5Y9_9GAMM|nr:phage tail sheath protein [Halorhodospira neutriphila]MBK1725724.1 phage tail protein [Halorhodospira neutriphila]